jgi:hypothetical protein
MVKHAVSVQIEGSGSFGAEADLDVEKLDPEHPPHEFVGHFARFDVNPIVAQLEIHAERAHGGDSHLLYLFGRRECYRFTMDSPESMSFRAVWTHINPKTGRPGFKR